MVTTLDSSQKRAISVLIVDDDDDIRATMAELLTDEGFTVETAADGAAALEALHSLAPLLILLDLSMPRMSGQEFRMEQLANPAIASIPVIVMTATDRPHEKAAQMRPDEVLPKPIKMQQLFASVARYCNSLQSGEPVSV